MIKSLKKLRPKQSGNVGFVGTRYCVGSLIFLILMISLAQAAPSNFIRPPAFPTPEPIPTPRTPARNAEWACSLTDLRDHNIFIGYGAFEFVAQDNVRRNCEADSRADCDGRLLCGPQETLDDLWTCQILNRRRQELHRGRGRSYIEASYNAAQSCFADSGYDSVFCELASIRRCMRASF